MTSLSVSKIKKYRQKLESEGFFLCNKDKGSYKYQIKTYPSGIDKMTLKERTNNPEENVSRRGKENLNKYIKKVIHEQPTISYKEMAALCIREGLSQEADFEQTGSNKYRRIQ